LPCDWKYVYLLCYLSSWQKHTYMQKSGKSTDRLVKKMVFEYIYPEGTIIVNGIHLANKLDGGQ